MGVHNYKDLRNHVGHKLECVEYGDGDNVAVDCITCGVVLIDFDRNLDKPTPAISDPCPRCGAQLKSNFYSGGGVKCTKCSYWFCY